MASSFINLGATWVATYEFRKDTFKADGDIKRDPEILAERARYEDRQHIETEENKKP